jgi:hypothetical protein
MRALAAGLYEVHHKFKVGIGTAEIFQDSGVDNFRFDFFDELEALR